MAKYLNLNSLEFILRLSVAYILIKNSGVGILTDLKDLGLPPHIYQIIQGMWDTGYMMHLVKLVELVGGLSLLFNFYVPLMLIGLIPVLINIYGMHVFLFSSFFTKGLYMLLVAGFLVFRHKEKFLPLLKRK